MGNNLNVNHYNDDDEIGKGTRASFKQARSAWIKKHATRENIDTFKLRDYEDDTAICQPDSLGWYDVKYLLELGADPNSCDSDGWSLLNIYTRWGRHKVVRMLVDDYKVDINGIDSTGVTAVHNTWQYHRLNFVNHKNMNCKTMQRDKKEYLHEMYNGWTAAEDMAKVDKVMRFLYDRGAKFNDHWKRCEAGLPFLLQQFIIAREKCRSSCVKVMGIVKHRLSQLNLTLIGKDVTIRIAQHIWTERMESDTHWPSDAYRRQSKRQKKAPSLYEPSHMTTRSKTKKK